MSRFQERLGCTAASAPYEYPRPSGRRFHTARFTCQYTDSAVRRRVRFNQVHQSTLFMDVHRLMQCHQKVMDSMYSTLGAR
jgi:hypothetical protein